jgi:hypothetical protein
MRKTSPLAIHRQTLRVLHGPALRRVGAGISDRTSGNASLAAQGDCVDTHPSSHCRETSLIGCP